MYSTRQWGVDWQRAVCIWYYLELEEKVRYRRMRALQSDLVRRMLDAGINLTKHLLTGEPVLFEGKLYVVKKVPKAKQ